MKPHHFQVGSFQYALNIGFDLFYIGVLHTGAKGIPLGMLTAVVAACGYAWLRNMGNVRGAIDRLLGWFTLKVAAGCALAAVAVWALSAWMAAPVSGLGNFVYLCVTCGAGSVVYLMVLTVTGILSPSQVKLLWHHPQEP